MSIVRILIDFHGSNASIRAIFRRSAQNERFTHMTHYQQVRVDRRKKTDVFLTSF